LASYKVYCPSVSWSVENTLTQNLANKKLSAEKRKKSRTGNKRWKHILHFSFDISPLFESVVVAQIAHLLSIILFSYLPFSKVSV